MLHNNNNSDDDDDEHHGTLPRSPTPLKSSCSTKHVTKKLMYIGILLFTLVIICLSTNDTTRMLIQVLFQYHEPSIRIFRSLIEIILLLICTAVSIRIYVHYISSHIIHSLLFQSSIDSQNTTSNTNNMNDDEEVVEDESYDRNYDGTLFQSVHNNDTHDHTNINNNNINDENDVNHHLETATPLPTTTTTTGSRRTPYIDDDDNDNSTKMPSSSSSSSLHDLSMSILIMALDLFIYTCMTLIFYLVSAIHTLQPSLSSSSSSSTMSTSSSSSTTNHHQQQQPSMVILIARIAAPTFPLLLFLFCMIRCIQHYQRYKEFYILLSYTMSAPFYNVTFRDGMIVRTVDR